MSNNHYHAREAAAALLKMARTTSDPKVAAGLIDAAAELAEQTGELPPPVSAKAPDIQTSAYFSEVRDTSPHTLSRTSESSGH